MWTLLTWLAIGLGLAIRFLGIGSQSFWFDEGYTAWMISHPFGEIVRLVRADTSPPLYYLMLRAWSLAFGHSEAALRSFSALFSCATLLLVVLIARKMLRSPAAVAGAAWAAALSFLLVSFAQEARCYALVSFLSIAGFYCLLRHLQSDSWRWLLPLAISLIGALYVHNMAAAYTLALTPVWLVLPSRHSISRRLRDGILTAILVGAVYGPWAAAVLQSQVRMVQQSFWVQPPTGQNMTWIFASITGARHFWSWDPILRWIPSFVLNSAEEISVLILCAAVVLPVLFSPGNGRRNAIALALYALLPPFAVAIYSCWKTPLLIDKVFLASAGLTPVLLFLPITMASRVARKSGTVLGIAALVMVGWSLWGFEREIIKEDWRTAAATVAKLPPAHRLIVYVANEGQLPFEYYYQPRAGEVRTGTPAGFFDRDPPRTMLRVLSETDLQPLKQNLIHDRYDEVVLVLSHTGWADPENRTEAMLKQHFQVMESFNMHDVRVLRFVIARESKP